MNFVSRLIDSDMRASDRAHQHFVLKRTACHRLIANHPYGILVDVQLVICYTKYFQEKKFGILTVGHLHIRRIELHSHRPIDLL